MLPAETPLPCFILCSPFGPGTPFQGPMFWWDSLRVAAVVVGLLVVILTPYCIRVCDDWGQAARFTAFGAFCLSVIATEYSRLGDDASPRLAVNLLGVAAALAGAVKFVIDIHPPSREKVHVPRWTQSQHRHPG